MMESPPPSADAVLQEEIDDEDTTTTCDEEIDRKEKERVLIKIIVINDVPYLWDAEEYMLLRNEHRILGTLDGLSSQPFKAAHYYAQSMSLPIKLSRYEAHYMVKHGIALAFRIPVLNQLQPQVSKEQVAELKAKRRNEELETCRNKRRLQVESMVDKIIEGKRKKGRVVPDRNTVIQEEMQKVALPFEITQIDVADPWVTDMDFIPCDIPEPNSSPLDRLRYKVFEDFLLRGKYYVATGLKFGGDFLVYPGDPIDHHSCYVVVCHNKARGALPPYVHKQIRLAAIVRKVLLVAYLDEERDEVYYVAMNEIKPKTKEGPEKPKRLSRNRNRRTSASADVVVDKNSEVKKTELSMQGTNAEDATLQES